MSLSLPGTPPQSRPVGCSWRPCGRLGREMEISTSVDARWRVREARRREGWRRAVAKNGGGIKDGSGRREGSYRGDFAPCLVRFARDGWSALPGEKRSRLEGLSWHSGPRFRPTRPRLDSWAWQVVVVSGLLRIRHVADDSMTVRYRGVAVAQSRGGVGMLFCTRRRRSDSFRLGCERGLAVLRTSAAKRVG